MSRTANPSISRDLIAQVDLIRVMSAASFFGYVNFMLPQPVAVIASSQENADTWNARVLDRPYAFTQVESIPDDVQCVVFMDTLDRLKDLDRSFSKIVYVEYMIDETSDRNAPFPYEAYRSASMMPVQNAVKNGHYRFFPLAPWMKNVSGWDLFKYFPAIIPEKIIYEPVSRAVVENPDNRLLG